MRLYLASTSPARLATLRAVGIEPVTIAPGVDEEAAVAAAAPLTAPEMVQLPFDVAGYEKIDTMSALDAWIARIVEVGHDARQPARKAIGVGIRGIDHLVVGVRGPYGRVRLLFGIEFGIDLGAIAGTTDTALHVPYQRNDRHDENGDDREAEKPGGDEFGIRFDDGCGRGR